jgi:hypothetical protein
MKSPVETARVIACAAALMAAIVAMPTYARGGHGGGHGSTTGSGSHGGSHVASASRSSSPTPHVAGAPFATQSHAAGSFLGIEPHVGTRRSPDAGTVHESRLSPGVKRDEHGHIARDPHAKEAFRRANPCPATGKTYGACPGYVVDHVQALKRGGADDPRNMQWQTTAEAKAKDRRE